MAPEVLVVGAGAAGLYAAICAARAGRRVVLLEKNLRPGLKILISGGGRCNLTTTRSGPDLEAQYGRTRGRWLRHALRAFPPSALVALVRDAGVPVQEEDLDKIFPVSGRAADVLQALLALAEEAGVELVTGAPMLDLQRDGAGFLVDSGSTSWAADRVILATGGLSYPKTGTTGDGYRVCQELGHRLVDPRPALAPLPAVLGTKKIEKGRKGSKGSNGKIDVSRNIKYFGGKSVEFGLNKVLIFTSLCNLVSSFRSLELSLNVSLVASSHTSCD